MRGLLLVELVLRHDTLVDYNIECKRPCVTLAYGARSTAFIYEVISHVPKAQKGRIGVAVELCRNLTPHALGVFLFGRKSIFVEKELLSRGCKKKMN